MNLFFKIYSNFQFLNTDLTPKFNILETLMIIQTVIVQRMLNQVMIIECGYWSLHPLFWNSAITLKDLLYRLFQKIERLNYFKRNDRIVMVWKFENAWNNVYFTLSQFKSNDILQHIFLSWYFISQSWVISLCYKYKPWKVWKNLIECTIYFLWF